MKTRETQNETEEVTIWFRAIRHPKLRAPLTGLMLLASVVGQSGCVSSATSLVPVEAPSEAAAATADAILEGDTLKIAFVGAPALDTTQEVRRDGRISLPVAGEIRAAGMRPAELSAQLSQRFASELLSNEVVVTVTESSFYVPVSGAVLRPGKIASKRQMTALEAVMEAGGFDHAKANVKRVVVVRREGETVSNHVLDLSLPLQGKPSQPFFLKPSDIVYVPERFVWF